MKVMTRTIDQGAYIWFLYVTNNKYYISHNFDKRINDEFILRNGLEVEYDDYTNFVELTPIEHIILGI